MTKFLTDGLLSQISRIRDLITAYNRLPDGAGLKTATLMNTYVQTAEKAIATGNIIKMLICFRKLKSCK